MNGEMLLKLQAWVDGELTGQDALQMESLAAGDPAVAALAGELRTTRSFLRGNELEVQLPESREFYWSKIRREIERADAAPQPATAPAGSFWAAISRMMVPASGLALVMLVAALSVKYFGSTPIEDALVEVENLSEDMGSISYRSQAEKMFVVYVYSKDQAAPEEETPAEGMSDLLFQ